MRLPFQQAGVANLALRNVHSRARLNVPRLRNQPPISARCEFRSINTFRARSTPRLVSNARIQLKFFDQSRQFSQTSILAVPLATNPLTKPPSHRGPILNAIIRLSAFFGIFIAGTGIAVIAFFAYDASTYREDVSGTDCAVSELALNPRRGGPKNLPIAEVLLDDEATDEFRAQKDKPKLVILGTGWGSVALLKNINPGDYHITVVSPSNYFLFTPMLPSATVGTLELRSLVEPVRRIVKRVKGHFLKAYAEDVDFSHKLVEVSQVDSNGVKQSFYLPYDKLVIGVGQWHCGCLRERRLMERRVNYEYAWRQRSGILRFPQRHRRCTQDP